MTCLSPPVRDKSEYTQLRFVPRGKSWIGELRSCGWMIAS